MTPFPSIAEDVIWSRVRNLLGLKKDMPIAQAELKALALKVALLSDYFTRRPGDKPDCYLGDSSLMAAYVAYFLPSNLTKIERPLSEIFLHPELETGSGGELSILDLGCGPGTASAGFMDFFFRKLCRDGAEIKLSITALDRVEANLKEAESLLGELWNAYSSVYTGGPVLNFEINSINTDLLQLAGSGTIKKRHDLVFISNSLVETAGGAAGIERRRELVELIASDYLKEKGSIIIIEPALKDASRDLLMLRESILREGRVNIYSPCLTIGRCGALDSSKDWCHEADEWESPQIVRSLDGLTGFDKSRLNYSYLVLRQDGLALSDIYSEASGDIFRVVSDLIKEKGKLKLFVCGKEGRALVERLDRDRSESNILLDSLRRGEIINVNPLYKKGPLFRLNKESAVEKAGSPPVDTV
ncbi:MAG: class I SAM-dependent methyltransferase [bacterium]|nr:class I SAM-dependent methyltransferase [bacterium]